MAVSDTGCGLTPELKTRMFEPFFTTKEAGTSLALSAVACTVRQPEGSVSVESQPGRGTSVSASFPLVSRYFR
jgi:C4-dicarboxylate-specific signal transduction histidine kinase